MAPRKLTQTSSPRKVRDVNTCYPSCPAPPSVVTQAPPVPPVTHTAIHAGLPFTGSDILGMVVIGLGILVVGGLLLFRSRRATKA
jgi:LPXTG-motif cell wall-anchored protein